MNSTNMVWLASYPRSGNTYLRTVLWHCFGLRSASIYRDDLGRNRELEAYVGHIERGPDGNISFPTGSIPLVKTHHPPQDENRAIYVVRDGRAASVSLWKFYNRKLPLADVIEGRHAFGTWSSHLQAWKPYERQNTLLLRYEDMCADLHGALREIGEFLEKDILKAEIPDRGTVASVDGRWVTTRSDWESEIPGDLLERFNELNEEMLRKMGYLS